MYYLAQNNEKTGPFTLEQLREMWRAGAVYPQTLYWEQGMTDWQPLERLAASLLIANPVTSPAGPMAFPVPSADPLAPVSTSHEPSPYDLPASHLPAAPVSTAPAPTRADALPLSSILTAPASPPVAASGPLIASTRLPANAGGIAPAGSAYPAAAGLSFPTPGVPSGPPQTPTAAYLSLGFALFGPVLVVFIPVAGWLLGGALILVAVVCGHSARAAIRQSGDRLPGKGIATAGLVLGYLGMVFGVLFVLGVVLLFGYAILHGGTYPTRAHH